MNLLFLLCCIEILGAAWCGAQTLMGSTGQPNVTTPVLPSASSSLMSTQSPTAGAPLSSSPSTSPSPGSESPTLHMMKECFPVLLVTGGLMIACTILLVSALLLAWKVCQLSARMKALGSNADQISDAEYRMGTAKQNKSKSETEPRETSVLLADSSQTQQETGDGNAEEEGGTVNEDNSKEAGDAASGEEAAPETKAESALSSKSQDQVIDPIKSGAASALEDTQETKNEV